MSDEMDELLERLKEEYTEKKKTQASRTPPPQKRSQQPKKRVSRSEKPQPSPSMDRMLADLRSELEAGGGRPKNNASPAASPPPAKPKPSGKKSVNRERLIAEIEREYQKQEAKREQKLAAARKKERELVAEKQRREQEAIAERERAKRRQQRRKEAMRQQAAEWLKKLNPRSEEGRWFEEFSYSYESKLEAAIDYLEAMRESGL